MKRRFGRAPPDHALGADRESLDVIKAIGIHPSHSLRFLGSSRAYSVVGGAKWISASNLPPLAIALHKVRICLSCHWNPPRNASQRFEILSGRDALKDQARGCNPPRWAGKIRNWQPVQSVALNPDRELVSQHACAGKTLSINGLGSYRALDSQQWQPGSPSDGCRRSVAPSWRPIEEA